MELHSLIKRFHIVIINDRFENSRQFYKSERCRTAAGPEYHRYESDKTSRIALKYLLNKYPNQYCSDDLKRNPDSRAEQMEKMQALQKQEEAERILTESEFFLPYGGTDC